MKETRADEQDRLTAELIEAHKRLDAAFDAEPRGDIAKGGRLSQYLALAQNVLCIIRRIEELERTE